MQGVHGEYSRNEMEANSMGLFLLSHRGIPYTKFSLQLGLLQEPEKSQHCSLIHLVSESIARPRFTQLGPVQNFLKLGFSCCLCSPLRLPSRT